MPLFIPLVNNHLYNFTAQHLHVVFTPTWCKQNLPPNLFPYQITSLVIRFQDIINTPIGRADDGITFIYFNHTSVSLDFKNNIYLGFLVVHPHPSVSSIIGARLRTTTKFSLIHASSVRHVVWNPRVHYQLKINFYKPQLCSRSSVVAIVVVNSSWWVLMLRTFARLTLSAKLN